MTTAAPAAPAARTPGWQRVLDAFMAAPERTLTNVQLGDVPGVQAFHQRIQDMRRYGYVVTDGVLVKKGRYAYTLVGTRSARRWEIVRPDRRAMRPHGHLLISYAEEDIADAVADAVAAIHENAEAIAKRERTPIRPAVRVSELREGSRAARDAAACLTGALGRVGDDPGDVLALAHAARDALKSGAMARSALVAVLNLLGDEVDEVLADYDCTGAVDDVVAWARERRDHAIASERRPAPRRPRADRGPTGPALMRKALEYHEQPMHAAKIAEWVMANGGDKVFKGKTPGASMASQLATSNKNGGEFVRVDAPGCYGLREWKDKQDEFGNPLLDLDPIR